MIHESEKIAENKYFWCLLLRPQIKARIHENKANGTMSEVLPDRNCFGRAKFVANDIALLLPRQSSLPCYFHAFRVLNMAGYGGVEKPGMLASEK